MRHMHLMPCKDPNCHTYAGPNAPESGLVSVLELWRSRGRLSLSGLGVL